MRVVIELPSSADTPLRAGDLYQIQINLPDAALRRIQEYARTHPNWKRALSAYVEENADVPAAIEVVGHGIQNNSQNERVYAIAFRPVSGVSSSRSSSISSSGASAAIVAPFLIGFGLVVAGLFAIGMLWDAANERYRLFLIEQGHEVPAPGDGAIARAFPVLAWAGVLFGVGYVLKQWGAFR